ncbi:cytoplasmic protein [Kosakonia pseudosacchari]|uniref:cytoplasmic protein n=1 Tax=Kosakonia pseudosacchari TaxID=1646340 RepID=UPI00187F7EC3|nr:cytoplasmic protein [Kosakonia pseudosacchari]QOV66408.1 cytoplasmic protein [Kosakonia pseudosacchari]WBU50017.1 cytoplasmic protein [Kosakonia pseudosacchari]
MNNVKEVDNNNVYLALEEKKSDEFILKQNKEALILSKNEAIERIARELVSIPAALVRLKWQNRREIYPLQVKEEIYGAVIEAIIAQKPELRDKIMGRLEANYQYILSRETATLRLSRKLSDGEYRTSNVTTVALEEDAAAKQSANIK